MSNKTAVARELGMSRSTLNSALKFIGHKG